MNRLSRWLLPCLAVVLSGCIESKEDFTVNPDGTGKITYEMTFQPFSLDESAANPEAQLKKIVQEELEKSRGVVAWKDVAFKRVDSEKIWFKGTAYFPDFSKLKLHRNGAEFKMLIPRLTTTEKGEMVLELIDDEQTKPKAEAAAAKPSEEELARQVSEQKANFQQARAMMTPLLSTMKMEKSFRLPGTITQSTNFKKDADGTLRVTFEGAKMLAAIDDMTKEDTFWREQIVAGRNFAKEGPESGEVLNQKLYGEKGPIRAVAAAPLKPVFDFVAEAAEAKEAYPSMIKQLGLVAKAGAVAPVAAAKGEGFKSLTVGGVRLVQFSDQDRGIRPFNWDAGYTLSIVGEFSGAVLSVTEGRLEKAVADNGEDLLPESEWEQKIQFPHLSEDKTTAVFEVKLEVPSPKVKGIKELRGVLEYVVGTGSKKIDLGISEFKPGAEGKELGAMIKEISESQWEKGAYDVSLVVELNKDQIRAVVFQGADGKRLESKPAGTSWSGDTTTLMFTTTSKPPEKGRVVIEVYEKFDRYEVPFSLKNLTLLGQPM